MKKFLENKAVENKNNYLRDHHHKEGSFLLGHMVGNEWQMVKDGEFYSVFVNEEKPTVLKAISNCDGVDDHSMLKKKFAAIIRSNIYDSIKAAEKLATKAGYKDFKIDEEEMMRLVNLKTYELFEEK